MQNENEKKKGKQLGTKDKPHRSWGRVEQRGKNRWRASFKHQGKLHRAPITFRTEQAAVAWLTSQKKSIDLAEAHEIEWTSPKDKALKEELDKTTVRELCELWLNDEKALPALSTRQGHRRHLNARVLCDSFPGVDSIADVLVKEVTIERVEHWWYQMQDVWPDMPDANQKAYKRLKTAFNYAIKKKLVTVNPVVIEGATAKVETKTEDRDLLELEEIAAIVENISPRLKAPVLILQWAGLRLGELLELRRKDITVKAGVMTLHITRGVRRIKDPITGKQIQQVDTPKTKAGKRKVVLPSKVAEKVRDHLASYVDSSPEALIVTTEKGKQMMDTNFRSRFKYAAKAAGRPEVSPHDLRRFFGTMLVENSGLNLEEARIIMGHTKKEQLLDYMRAAAKKEQKAANNFDKLIS